MIRNLAEEKGGYVQDKTRYKCRVQLSDERYANAYACAPGLPGTLHQAVHRALGEIAINVQKWGTSKVILFLNRLIKVGAPLATNLDANSKIVT